MLLFLCIFLTLGGGDAGNPKGVVLTHHTLVTAVASLQGFVDLGNIKMGPDDSFLSFLTLAHIFDRVVEEFMLSVGGHIGYWQVRVHRLFHTQGVFMFYSLAWVTHYLPKMPCN